MRYDLKQGIGETPRKKNENPRTRKSKTLTRKSYYAARCLGRFSPPYLDPTGRKENALSEAAWINTNCSIPNGGRRISESSIYVEHVSACAECPTRGLLVVAVYLGARNHAALCPWPIPLPSSSAKPYHSCT